MCFHVEMYIGVLCVYMLKVSAAINHGSHYAIQALELINQIYCFKQLCTVKHYQISCRTVLEWHVKKTEQESFHDPTTSNLSW